jgi:hypothetical protein
MFEVHVNQIAHGDGRVVQRRVVASGEPVQVVAQPRLDDGHDLAVRFCHEATMFARGYYGQIDLRRARSQPRH